MTDTDRLEFLLEHFMLDDVGDDHFCPGVIIDNESLEDRLTFGVYKNGEAKSLISSINEDFRVIIDNAIKAHCEEENDDQRRINSIS